MFPTRENPSRTDLLVFAALWALFWPLLALLWRHAGERLGVAAAVSAACVVLTALFHREGRLRFVFWGGALTSILLALGLAAQGMHAETGVRSALRAGVFTTLCTVGIAGAAAVLMSPGAGRALYRAWMSAVFPVGWAVFHLLLSAAYFGVVTPVGLLMRALGRDPMQRRFDRTASTYWIVRGKSNDIIRYFRQS